MFMIMGMVYIIPGLIYFTYFINRLMKKKNLFYRKDRNDEGMLACIFIVVLLISFPAINYIRIYGTIYFHLLVICLILEICNLFLKRFAIFSKLFITGLLPVAILVGLFTYGYVNMNHIVKTEYVLNSEKIASLTIAQVTDLHMTTTMGIDKLKDVCNKISTSNPDIVVLTGDIFDESTPLEDMEDACYELSQIKNTKGIYYVYGNHDTASYSTTPNFSEEQIRDHLTKNGIVVLNDEVAKVDKITIIGRKDAHYAGDNIRLSAKDLLSGLDKNQYIIVLDHQPLDLELNAKYGADLQLSGHTHGGQMFPMCQIENLLSDRLVYGIRQIDNFYAITSSGIAGWGYPIKTGAPSEYVIIQIN